jgi:hypothetical protein
MALRPDIKAKLDSLGLPESALENMPDNLPGGWGMHQYTNDEGNTAITYQRPGNHPFEVEFVAETEQDARAMMTAWLREHRGL